MPSPHASSMHLLGKGATRQRPLYALLQERPHAYQKRTQSTFNVPSHSNGLCSMHARPGNGGIKLPMAHMEGKSSSPNTISSSSLSSSGKRPFLRRKLLA